MASFMVDMRQQAYLDNFSMVNSWKFDSNISREMIVSRDMILSIHGYTFLH